MAVALNAITHLFAECEQEVPGSEYNLNEYNTVFIGIHIGHHLLLHNASLHQFVQPPQCQLVVVHRSAQWGHFPAARLEEMAQKLVRSLKPLAQLIHPV